MGSEANVIGSIGVHRTRREKSQTAHENAGPVCLMVTKERYLKWRMGGQYGTGTRNIAIQFRCRHRNRVVSGAHAGRLFCYRYAGPNLLAAYAEERAGRPRSRPWRLRNVWSTPNCFDERLKRLRHALARRA